MSTIDVRRRAAVDVIAAALPQIPVYCPDCGGVDPACPRTKDTEPDRSTATLVYNALRDAGMLDHFATGYSPVLAALDRCRHGRHAKDSCLSCPGNQSAGNELLSPGQRIGTSLYGEPIAVPDQMDHRSNPHRWTPSFGGFK